MSWTGTTRQTAVVRTSAHLKCPSPVAGSDVPTWTRLNSDSGTNVTVFSQNKTEEPTTPDHTRFQYSAKDKTLTITDVQPDDAGLYYCDGKPAAYLTVIKDEQPEGGER